MTEETKLFEKRLRLSLTVLVCLWGLAWSLNLVFTALLFPERLGPILRFWPTWVHLATILAMLGASLVVRRMETSSAQLSRIESTITVLQGVTIGAMLYPTPREFRPELGFLFGIVIILVLRAAFLPSPPRRTALVGALAVLPTIIATYPVQARGEPNVYFPSPIAAVIGLSIWAAVSVGCTVLISAVVYGLAKRVREATKLGQYTLKEKIGQGGMGVVYLAEHALLRRPTAVKLLSEVHGDAGALTRFEREVQRTSELSSPHVVAVYDFGRTEDGVFYYAMEYLDGLDLETIVTEDGPFPPGRVVHVVRQIAEALADAHEVGLVHRDVKPANVIVSPRARAHDHVKLLDFGLVKDLDAEATAHGRPAGTPLYMAPESFTAPSKVDDRADIYSLGATAYALLTGKPPFEAKTMVALAEEHVKTKPPSPSMRSGRDLPKKLDAVVMACLAKSPDDRPETAEALIEALDACDDVDPWTEDDARAWWRDRAPALRKSKSRTPADVTEIRLAR